MKIPRSLIATAASLALPAAPGWAVPQGSAPPVQVGTTSGTVAAGNDGRIVGALQSGKTALGVTGGTVTLPSVPQTAALVLTGTLTSALVLQVPAGTAWHGAVVNQTAGAYGITLQVAGQSAPPLNLAPGATRQVTSDGTTLTAESSCDATGANDCSGAMVRATGGTAARTEAARAADASNILDFGAKCDGASHPLSAGYGTLAAAQAVFPQALALTDEVDTVATRLALARTNAAFIPKTAGCVLGDLVTAGSNQLVWGRRSVVIPAAGASRMILLQGYGNVVEGLDIHDNGALAAQSTLAATASAGDTSILVGPVTSGPAVQVGQRISLRLNAGTHVTTWISSVTASGSNVVVGLRDPLPTVVPVAGILTTVSAGATLASAGNGFAATFGAIHVRDATRFALRNIIGANIWGGINTDDPSPSNGYGASKGVVDGVSFAGIRMFGIIKGRNASDNWFGKAQLWGGYYSTMAATGDGSTTTFQLPEQVNLTREMAVTVGGVAKTAGTDYTIAANGLSIALVSAPAAGAAIGIGFQVYGDDGLIDDGRDTTLASGGNYYQNVSALTFRRCGLLKGAQLYTVSGGTIFDTCSEEALVLDGTSQTGVVNALPGWGSIASLYVTGGAAGAKAGPIFLGPQATGYSVSGVAPIPVQIDSGSDLTGRVFGKGASFADYNNGIVKYSVDAAGNASFKGTIGALVLNPAGNTFSFSSQYGYVANASANSNLVLQSVGTNGLLQEQATATIKQTIGSTDMLVTDANGTKLPKLSAAPATAPGVGYLRLFALPGTNAGTCKLMAQAGTSATATAVLDNIGAGC